VTNSPSDPPGQQRPALRERKRRRTRESILNAAWLLFTRDGVASTSVRDIADLAEVGEVTVYNYFKTRGDLIDAVITEQADVTVTREAVELLGAEGGPLEVLAAFAERLRSETTADLQTLRRFRKAVSADPDLRGPYLCVRERSTEALIEALLPRAEQSGLSEADLRLLCFAFNAMADAVSEAQPASTTPERWADDLAHAVSLLRAGWHGSSK
jgi:AcrR family transcriptional regulator